MLILVIFWAQNNKMTETSEVIENTDPDATENKSEDADKSDNPSRVFKHYILTPANLKHIPSKKEYSKSEVMDSIFYEIGKSQEDFTKMIENKQNISENIISMFTIPFRDETTYLQCSKELDFTQLERIERIIRLRQEKILPFFLNQQYFPLLTDPKLSLCRLDLPDYKNSVAQISDIDFKKKNVIIKLKGDEEYYNSIIRERRGRAQVRYLDSLKTKAIVGMNYKGKLYRGPMIIMKIPFRNIKVFLDDIPQEDYDFYANNPVIPISESDKKKLEIARSGFLQKGSEHFLPVPEQLEITEYIDLRKAKGKYDIVAPDITIKAGYDKDLTKRNGIPLLFKLVSTPDNRVGVVVDIVDGMIKIVTTHNNIIQLPLTTELTIVPDDNKARDAVNRRMFPGDFVKLSDGTTDGFTGQITHTYNKLIFGEFVSPHQALRCFVESKDALIFHDNEGPIYNTV